LKHQIILYYSVHDRPLSTDAETKDFARLTSYPVRGWTGKNKAFCSPGSQNGRCVIKVYFTLAVPLFLYIICSASLTKEQSLPNIRAIPKYVTAEILLL